jgi:tetratricopeptide (TPR) repeat protein
LIERRDLGLKRLASDFNGILINFQANTLLLAIPLIGLVAFLLLESFSLTSQFWSNLGWVQLTRLSFLDKIAEAPIVYFNNALQVDDKNRGAYIGAGMTYARVLDESNAQIMWQQGETQADLLIQLGDQLQERGLLDEAFIYFRASAQLAETRPAEGDFRSAKLCQINLPDFEKLTAKNRSYCWRYFDQNKGNLLLDGQFDHTTKWAWAGTSFFKNSTEATLDLDFSTGATEASLMLTGLTSGLHKGIYQRVTLEPGTKIRFGGYFRTENAVDLAARLLYIEWRQAGEIHGTHLYTADSSIEWIYLERIFILPDGSEPWVNLYPVLLNGRGTVWTDNLHVEILPKEHSLN